MSKFSPVIVTIEELVKWSSEGMLSFSDRYQRTINVKEDEKINIVEGVINAGVLLNSVLLCKYVDESSQITKYEVVQAQQQIKAILDFIIYEKFSICTLGNREAKKFSEFSQTMQDEIMQCKITAIIVEGESEEVIEEIFSKINSPL